MRVERLSRWKQRGAAIAGVRKWTCWYNSSVKRFVLAEDENVTTEGKVLSHDRWELSAYDVK